jgi:hypothetical protein
MLMKFDMGRVSLSMRPKMRPFDDYQNNYNRVFCGRSGGRSFCKKEPSGNFPKKSLR